MVLTSCILYIMCHFVNPLKWILSLHTVILKVCQRITYPIYSKEKHGLRSDISNLPLTKNFNTYVYPVNKKSSTSILTLILNDTTVFNVLQKQYGLEQLVVYLYWYSSTVYCEYCSLNIPFFYWYIKVEARHGVSCRRCKGLKWGWLFLLIPVLDLTN